MVICRDARPCVSTTNVMSFSNGCVSSNASPLPFQPIFHFKSDYTFGKSNSEFTILLMGRVKLETLAYMASLDPGFRIRTKKWGRVELG